MTASPRVRRGVVLALALAASAACDAPLTRAECEQLLDRYTELLIRADRPELGAQQRLRVNEDTRAKAAADPAFAQCVERVSRSDFNCAMAAQSPDELERCLI